LRDIFTMVALTGFAKLIPAFTVMLRNVGDLDVGTTFSGETLLLAQVANTSTIVSIPGYGAHPLSAVNRNGQDALRINEDRTMGTWDFRAGFITPEEDYLYVTFTGFITSAPQNLPYLRSNFANGTTTGYGFSFMSAYLETGAPKYKSLSTKVFVGSAQLISDIPGGHISAVEMQLSEVSY